MRVVDQNGVLQEIPFTLGEKGRGRREERVQLSNRQGQAPTSSEAVGYFLIEGGKRTHVVLTKPRSGQRGCLLRVDTRGTYTRGQNEGVVKLIAGLAELLTFGNFADGDAGNLGHQSDELWHVKTPAVFGVTLSGGAYKGYGHRVIIVTCKFEVKMMTRDELCQLIATDEDPDVVEVVRMYADQLHEEVRGALAVADELEAATAGETELGDGECVHYIPHYPGSVEAAFEQFKVAIPAPLRGRFEGGIEGVRAGTLVPGRRAVVHLKVDSGGGSRYRGEVVTVRGLSPLIGDLPEEGRELCKSNSPYAAGRGCFVALIEDEGWCVAWRQWKDGQPYCLLLADAMGIHTLWVEAGRVRTEAWVGHEAITPTASDVTDQFPEW